MKAFRSGLFAMTCIAMATSQIAWAQTAAADGAEAAASDGGKSVLETVLVQARRRDERLLDVPSAVSVMHSESLKNSGVANVATLTQFAPGLNVAEGVDNSTARFFIRGMGTATPAVGIEPAVPVYIDDIYTPSGLGSNINLFAVDRVEVLRGPQGTLYGRNSFGGAIKVYTKGLTNKSEGYVEVATGDHNRRDIKAELQGAIQPDRLWFGIGVASLTREGLQSSPTSDWKGWAENTKVAKAKLQFDATKDLRFTLAYDKTDSDAPAKQAKIASIGNYIFNTCCLSNYPGTVANRAQSSADPDVIDSNVQGNTKVFADGLTATAKWTLSPELSIKYLGSHRKMRNVRVFDIDGTAAPFLTVGEDLRLDGKSHELQLNWTGEKANVVAGLFNYREDTDSDSAEVNDFLQFLDTKHQAKIVIDPNGQPTAVDIRRVFRGLSQRTRSNAAFVNVGYELTDKLNVTAGVRYTKDHKETMGNGPSTVYVGGTLANFSSNPPFSIPAGATIINTSFGAQPSASRDFSSTTPELVLDYKPWRNQLFYGSYKQGFQGGTIFPAANVVPTALPSTNAQGVDAFELGSKGVYLGGLLSLNAAAYYNRYKDLIVSVNTPVSIEVSATGFAGVPKNAGAAHSKGIELESLWQLSKDFSITANIALNRFSVTDVTAVDPKTGQPVNVSNTFLDVPTLAPNTQGNVRAEYSFMAMHETAARVWLNAFFRSKMGINAANAAESSGIGLVTSNPVSDPYYISKGMTQLSAGITLTSADKKTRVDLIGQNLNNVRRPVASIAVVPEFFGAIQQWNEPRSWRLSLTRSF